MAVVRGRVRSRGASPRRGIISAIPFILAVASIVFTTIASAQGLEPLSGPGVVVEADAGSVTVDGYSRAGVTNISSILWGSIDRLDATATGSVSRFETGHLAAYGDVHTAARFGAAVSPIVFAWEADGGGGAYRGQPSSGYIRTALRVTHVTDAHDRVWLTTGIGRAGATGSYGTVRGGVGASAQRHGFTGVVTADAIHAGANYADFTGRVAWSPSPGTALARTSVDVTAGARTSNSVIGRRDWSEIGATVRLLGSSAFTVAYGTAPSDPERAIQAVRFASFGIRLTFGGRSSWSSLPEVSRYAAAISTASTTALSDVSSDGTRTLIIHSTGARSLDLIGDFTGWRALPMKRVGDGVWMIRIILRPGTHRLNIRADGGDWLPAPGLPQTPDEFGGEASVLVVP